MKTKQILVAICCFLFACCAAQAWTHGSGGGGGGSVFQTLKIGGGGYVRNGMIAADGTKVIRTDTYGAYWWSGTAWVQLVTVNSMPAGDPLSTPQGCLNAVATCGVYDIQVAASNTNVAYMMIGGYVYKTSNLKSGASATWAATNFPQCTSCVANGNSGKQAQDGPHIAIDPANAATVVVGTYGGVYYSTNSGASVSGPSASVPAPTGATLGEGVLVLFDPSSASGGATPTLYAASYGNGVYKTTAGASGTWSLTTSGPTQHFMMTIGPDGELYYVPASASSNTLYLYNGSTWSTQALGGNGNPLTAVALDPTHPTFASNAFLTAVNAAGQTLYSTNSGGTWSSPATAARSCTSDIPWLCNTNETYMSTGGIAYDPSQSNVAYLYEGIGVWKTAPSAGATVTWNATSTGIENMVANWVSTPPSGNPMFAFWDRPIFTDTNLAAYPSQHGVSYSFSIILGAQVDYAKSSPATSFVVADWFNNESTGITSNNGGTDGSPSNWTICSTSPSVSAPNAYWGSVANGGNGFAGSVAASTPTNFMWAMSDNAAMFYTTDACATWHIAQPSGIDTTTASKQGWGFAYYNNRHILCADSASGFFYAYNDGADDGSSSLAGIYKFSSGGSVGSRTLSGNIDTNDGFDVELSCVPGVSGEMFYTSGQQQPGPYPHTQFFYDCTDSAPGATGGAITCSQVSNVKEVWAFGFGKAKTGGSGFPAIFIAGWVSGVYGVYESDDHAATWELLSTNPCNSLDIPKTVMGDLNNYGRVFVGFSGSSFCYKP